MVAVEIHKTETIPTATDAVSHNSELGKRTPPEKYGSLANHLAAILVIEP